MGQPFGGLDSGRTPQFLKDVDLFFIIAGLQWTSPWLVRIMEWVPSAAVRHPLGAMKRVAGVSNHSGPAAWLCYSLADIPDSTARSLFDNIFSNSAGTQDARIF